MKSEAKTVEFSEIWRLYQTLALTNESFEDDLALRFDKYIRTNNEYNIVTNQEREEERNKRDHPEFANRFFQSYYEDYATEIANSDFPVFMQTCDMNFGFTMPKGAGTGVAPKCDEFERMPPEEKQKVKVDILKELAIVYARKANLANQFKDDYSREAMTEKNVAMQNFLIYANRYNELVAEKDKLQFAISYDGGKQSALLDASIPGFSRLSVHFGRTENLDTILTNVNRAVGREIYPTMMTSRYNKKTGQYERVSVVDDKRLYLEQAQYAMPDFGVTNTGIITGWMDDGHQKVLETLEKMGSSKLKCFAYFMYPNLNDREIFYLSEMAGFGRGTLHRLKEMLKARSKMYNLSDRRKTYLQEYLEYAKTETRTSKLMELYRYYMSTKEFSEDKISTQSFINLLESSGIPKEEIVEVSKQVLKNNQLDIDAFFSRDENDLMVVKEKTLAKMYPKEEKINTRIGFLGKLLKERSKKTDILSVDPDTLIENEEQFLNAVTQVGGEEEKDFAEYVLRPLLQLHDEIEEDEREPIVILEDAFSGYQLLLEQDASQEEIFPSFVKLLREIEIDSELVQQFMIAQGDVIEVASNQTSSTAYLAMSQMVNEVPVEIRAKCEEGERTEEKNMVRTENAKQKADKSNKETLNPNNNG